jgi:hypothetical protein
LYDFEVPDIWKNYRFSVFELENGNSLMKNENFLFWHDQRKMHYNEDFVPKFTDILVFLNWLSKVLYYHNLIVVFRIFEKAVPKNIAEHSVRISEKLYTRVKLKDYNRLLKT